jgi:virulence-associated protein VapD
MKDKREKLTRLQFNYTQGEYRKLQQVRRKAGHTTLTQTIRAATAVFDWFLSCRSKGSTLCLREKDGTVRDLVFFPYDAEVFFPYDAEV